MANVLYVKVNPKQDNFSFSARLANSFLDEYKKANPNDEVTMLDVYNDHIPLIDGDVLSAWGKFASNQELTAAEQEKAGRLQELVNQFIEADKVVFSAPMWNFGFPPLMKAYVDALCVAGKTFKYTENGPVGLVPNKPVLLIEARGGIFSEGPAKTMEHTESYIRAVLGFIGVQNMQTIICEGLNLDPSKSEDVFTASEKQAKALAVEF